MTSSRPGKTGAELSLAVAHEIVRRAAHELRNALNGVAVNVEVIRSRSPRGGGSAEVITFANHASTQMSVATELTEALLRLITTMTSAGVLKTDGARSNAGGESDLELMIYGEQAQVFVSDIKPLTDRIGISVKDTDRGVILTVSLKDKTHSKE